MHIRNVRIDWMLKYDSNPFLCVDIDGYERPTFRYEAIPVGGSTFYHARVGEEVRFMIHNPRDEHGYGGAKFELPMADGRVATFRGPWSSNTATYHRLVGGPHVVLVGSNVGALYLTVEALNEALARCVHPGIQVHAVETKWPFADLGDAQNSWSSASSPENTSIAYYLRKEDREKLRLSCDRCGAETYLNEDYARRRHAFAVQHRHAVEEFSDAR